MSAIVNLKPCPFCGGKGAIMPYYHECVDENGEVYEKESFYCKCTKCAISTPLVSCEEAAADMWEERYLQ